MLGLLDWVMRNSSYVSQDIYPPSLLSFACASPKNLRKTLAATNKKPHFHRPATTDGKPHFRCLVGHPPHQTPPLNRTSAPRTWTIGRASRSVVGVAAATSGC